MTTRYKATQFTDGNGHVCAVRDTVTDEVLNVYHTLAAAQKVAERMNAAYQAGYDDGFKAGQESNQ